MHGIVDARGEDGETEVGRKQERGRKKEKEKRKTILQETPDYSSHVPPAPAVPNTQATDSHTHSPHVRIHEPQPREQGSCASGLCLLSAAGGERRRLGRGDLGGRGAWVGSSGYRGIRLV